MKLSKLTLRLRPLGQRGVAHLMIPLFAILLVGVTGSYMVVASNANSTNNGTGGASASARQSAKSPKSLGSKGLLLVYGGDGFTGVQVYGRDMDLKTHTCGSTWDSNGLIEKSLPKPIPKGDSWRIKPRVFHCTHTSGIEKYTINYKKNNTVYATDLAVDIDSSACTAVYPDPVRSAKSDYNNGKCVSVNVEKIVPKDVTIAVKPSLMTNNKGIKGYVDIGAADVIKNNCTGQVNVTLTLAPDKVVKDINLPLKYAGKQTVKGKVYQPRCFAQLNFTNLKAGTYNVAAHFSGNVFFKAGLGGVNIDVPAAANAAANGTGGAQAP